jgi:hypothetical protein
LISPKGERRRQIKDEKSQLNKVVLSLARDAGARREPQKHHDKIIDI